MPNLEALLQNISALTPFSLALVSFVGLAVGVAPSSFPLLSVAAGLAAGSATADSSKRQGEAFWLSVAFALGIATVDAVIGALFGLAGFAVMRILARFLDIAYALLGVVLLIMGLALLRVVHVAIPVLSPFPKRAQSFAGSYLLGLPFGLSTCPACTPLLLPVVVAAASTTDPAMGAGLMFTFGLARGIPIVAAGTAASEFAHARQMRSFIRWVERVGGILMLAAAAHFFNQGTPFARWLAP